MHMLAVTKFINENPDNWRELLSNSPYNINIKEDDSYVILKYSQIDSDFNEQICKECRGLILSKNEDYKPVRLAFYKFFNFGEEFADKIDWKSCKTRAKIDGSMMSAWYHNGKWHLSTSGAIDAWKTPASNQDDLSFGDVFEKALRNNGLTWDGLCRYLDQEHCYTFELVSPETRVVIPYKKADLYLIGCRNMETLQEVEIEDADIAIRGILKTPKLYNLGNVKACVQAAEHLGYNEEGYVVVDKNYHRIKIKSPSYVAAHHLRLNGEVTEAKIFDIIERGESNEFLNYFPEYKEIFDNIKKKESDFIKNLTLLLHEIHNNIKESPVGTHLNNGELVTRSHFAKIFMSEDRKEFSGFLFKLLDTDLIEYFAKNEYSKLPKNKKLNYLKIKG